jgi:nucleoside phosphorylase
MKPRREDYTVGWICALTTELAAAQEMLDLEHDETLLDRGPSSNDENSYALGSIGGHNIVIVYLPAGQIGTNQAAVKAVQMRATFTGLRFGLLVGIGGGVPSKSVDIRLGDVVISQPSRTLGGVVQWDFGKNTLRGFERSGLLNTPPPVLLDAVQRVGANKIRGRSKLLQHIAKLGCHEQFQRSEAGPDMLFEATYEHEGGQTCETCSTGRQVVRQPRNGEEVVVHYGTVASGNQVMKNALERDRISLELDGVLCFEMEAAGLMNSFPSLVIRGICDYADSHKNKRWQHYAAATAAAYAKELLLAITPKDVASTLTAKETMLRK